MSRRTTNYHKKPSAICQLGKQDQHFGKLLRNVNLENHDQVTKKVLSQQLKALIAAGIVSRTIIPTMPPQTQYALTPGRQTDPWIDGEAVANGRAAG